LIAEVFSSKVWSIDWPFLFLNEFLGILVRGGAKKKQISKASPKVEKSHKSRKHDTDDDEDDEDSHYEKQQPIKKKETKGKKAGKSTSSSKGKSGGKKMQLIPWMDSKGKKGAAKVNWKERLEQIAKQGQLAYKEVYRRAKVTKLIVLLIKHCSSLGFHFFRC